MLHLTLKYLLPHKHLLMAPHHCSPSGSLIWPCWACTSADWHDPESRFRTAKTLSFLTSSSRLRGSARNMSVEHAYQEKR